MDEFKLIKKFNSLITSELPSGDIGPGDDAALITTINSGELLVSKDLLVENVHFDFNLSSPEDIGWKALAVNESDICAMGGITKGYLIGIALPKERQDFAERIYQGMNEYLVYSQPQVPIYGGDTVASPFVTISVTVLGAAKKPVTRSAAKVGDSLWISGVLGASGLGLSSLQGKAILKNLEFEEAHRRPKPQKALSKFLVENNLANSMIDVSDGLFQDLLHIGEKSGVNLTIDFLNVPCALDDVDEKRKFELVNGGEDYQLLFSSDRVNDELMSGKTACTKIGSVTEKSAECEIIINTNNSSFPLKEFLKIHQINSLGFNHF